MLGIRPSYATGFARRGESRYPGLWKGLIGAWVPFFGPTGALVRDMSGKHRDGTISGSTQHSLYGSYVYGTGFYGMPSNLYGSGFYSAGIYGEQYGGISFAPSKYGTALYLDGSTDHTIIEDHIDFTPVLTPFSIVIDVYMDDATSFPIITKGIYNTDGEWVLATDSSDKLYVHFFDESVADCYIGQLTDAAVTTACEGLWVQITMTYDGGALSAGIKLYINESLVASSDDENDTFVSVENLTHAVWLGRDDTTYANGKIGSAMIYNRVLTGAEIALLARKPFALFETGEIWNIQR